MDSSTLNIIFISGTIIIAIGLFMAIDAYLDRLGKKRIEEIKEKYCNEPDGHRSGA